MAIVILLVGLRKGSIAFSSWKSEGEHNLDTADIFSIYSEIVEIIAKRKKRIIEDYEFERVSDNKDLLKDIIKDERRQWLYAEIYALKEPEREVMLLSLQDDLSDESIAEIMGISVQNVRVIRFRVKNKLREKYEEEAV